MRRGKQSKLRYGYDPAVWSPNLEVPNTVNINGNPNVRTVVSVKARLDNEERQRRQWDEQRAYEKEVEEKQELARITASDAVTARMDNG